MKKWKRLTKRIVITAIALSLCGVGLVFGFDAWNKHLGNVKFTFYGRVVDSNGVGISGVKILGKVGYVPITTIPRSMWKDYRKYVQIETVTDTDGLFVVRGRAWSLDFSLDHWVCPGLVSWNDGGGMQRGFVTYTEKNKLTDYNTPEAAYIYEFVPINSPEAKWVQSRHYHPPMPR